MPLWLKDLLCFVLYWLVIEFVLLSFNLDKVTTMCLFGMFMYWYGSIIQRKFDEAKKKERAKCRTLNNLEG